MFIKLCNKNPIIMAEKRFELRGVDKTMLVFDDKISLKARGLLGFLNLGGRKSIPLSKITSVQFHAGNVFTRGFIELSIVGGIEGSGILSLRNTENTIYFKNKYRKHAEEIANFLEETLANNENINNGSFSSADEIMKYQNLFDKGIISKDEFEQKKKELLGK